MFEGWRIYTAPDDPIRKTTRDSAPPNFDIITAFAHDTAQIDLSAHDTGPTPIGNHALPQTRLNPPTAVIGQSRQSPDAEPLRSLPIWICHITRCYAFNPVDPIL